MGRSPCCSKEGLNRGAWTAQEDKILTDYVMLHGEGRWRTLPKKAGLNRCGKSCRLRWLNYLRPDIKRGDISEDEEELIIRMHKLLGNRWSLIAGRLPGRTDNEIKNYWNTNLAKKLQQSQASPSSLPTKKRSSAGGKGKKSPSKRPKSDAKARTSAMRSMGAMSQPFDDHVRSASTDAKLAKEEEEQEEETRQNIENRSPGEVAQEAGLEDGLRDVYIGPGCGVSSLVDSETARFEAQGMAGDVENNNEDLDFLFDKALLEEYLMGDACTIPPGLDSDIESLRVILDPEVGWI